MIADALQADVGMQSNLSASPIGISRAMFVLALYQVHIILALRVGTVLIGTCYRLHLEHVRTVSGKGPGKATS